MIGFRILFTILALIFATAAGEKMIARGQTFAARIASLALGLAMLGFIFLLWRVR